MLSLIMMKPQIIWSQIRDWEHQIQQMRIQAKLELLGLTLMRQKLNRKDSENVFNRV